MTDAISDDYMREMLGRSRPYTIVLLHRTGKRDQPGADAVVWEHGRRNFALRASGKCTRSVRFRGIAYRSDALRADP